MHIAFSMRSITTLQRACIGVALTHARPFRYALPLLTLMSTYWDLQRRSNVIRQKLSSNTHLEPLLMDMLWSHMVGTLLNYRLLLTPREKVHTLPIHFVMLYLLSRPKIKVPGKAKGQDNGRRQHGVLRVSTPTIHRWINHQSFPRSHLFKCEALCSTRHSSVLGFGQHTD